MGGDKKQLAIGVSGPSGGGKGANQPIFKGSKPKKKKKTFMSERLQETKQVQHPD